MQRFVATPHKALSVRKRPLSRNPESSYNSYESFHEFEIYLTILSNECSDSESNENLKRKRKVHNNAKCTLIILAKIHVQT